MRDESMRYAQATARVLHRLRRHPGPPVSLGTSAVVCARRPRCLPVVCDVCDERYMPASRADDERADRRRADDGQTTRRRRTEGPSGGSRWPLHFTNET